MLVTLNLNRLGQSSVQLGVLAVLSKDNVSSASRLLIQAGRDRSVVLFSFHEEWTHGSRRERPKFFGDCVS